MPTREEDAVAPTLAADSSGRETLMSEPVPEIPASRRIQLIPRGTSVGRYVIAERLGWGGMGVVYRARDPRLGREVALKLVMPIGDVVSAQQRLEIEAQAMAKLNHPNVVAVYDIGTYNEQLFIAMELCSGGSLSRWIKKPQPWRAIVARFIAAGRGLAAAHAIGLVHRDFKPDNVLLTDGGGVKVSDFGLVREEDRERATDAIEGTPAYMAPEQLVLGVVDARADQFAFAVSMWEALCGCKPFVAAPGGDILEATLAAIRSRKRMRDADSMVPKPLIKIMERALEPEPAGRWPTLDDMLRALEATIAPNRAPLAIAAGLVAVTAIGIAAYALSRPPPVDAALPRRIAMELGPVYVIAAHHAPTEDDAARAYQHAFAATEDPKYRLAAALAMVAAQNCGASAELDRYAAETHKRLIDVLSDSDYHRHTELRTTCANDPSSAMEDLQEIEQLADDLFRTDPERAFLALDHAIRVANGRKPVLYLTLGDYRSAQGQCSPARAAYEYYIQIGKLSPEDVADVRRRQQTCVQQN